MSYEFPDLSAVRRVLVTKLRHHGDVLLAGPVLSALRRRLPQAQIDALVYRDTQDMLSGHPALDVLHTLDRNGRREGMFVQWGRERALLRQLKARKYDLLVHLSTHNRGAWLARLLAPACSVAPAKPGRFWRRSFTHLYQEVGGNRRHTVENNLDSLRRLGLWPEEEDKRLILTPGAEAERAVLARLHRLGLTPGAYVLLHPTSRWLFKCWPEARVTELAQRLAAEVFALLFTSGPDAREIAMVERIRAGIGRPTSSLAGQLSLKELAALIAQARLFIGVDSAPMHMAAAMQTPLAVVFGPSGEIDWGPWMAPGRVITSAHTCRPCGRDGCGGGKRSDCLEAIPVDAVHAAAISLMSPV